LERGRRNDGAIFQFRPHLETLALLLPRQKGIVFPLLSLLELQEDKHGAQREEDVTPATATTAHWGRERGRRVQGKNASNGCRQQRELLLRVEGPFRRRIASSLRSRERGRAGVCVPLEERAGKERNAVEVSDPRARPSVSARRRAKRRQSRK